MVGMSLASLGRVMMGVVAMTGSRVCMVGSGLMLVVFIMLGRFAW
jgi:hypothetical protein